ncbi:unnamed protein product [Cuscuta europaea]|uniref:Uncharacterized protein n=1 Tax=Cuscuta europaea TaxID=41803 RepID=A0A9P1EES6_CUSEU|nr:unnamed protein product [Cuscuta europaea]
MPRWQTSDMANLMSPLACLASCLIGSSSSTSSSKPLYSLPSSPISTTMAAVSTISMLDSTFEADNLTNQFFPILENKFLFGCNDQRSSAPSVMSSFLGIGKVRVLSIDASGPEGSSPVSCSCAGKTGPRC